MIIWEVLMISGKKNRGKKATKDFSKMTKEEQIGELKKRDLEYKREMREAIEPLEKASWRQTITENSLLMNTLLSL